MYQKDCSVSIWLRALTIWKNHILDYWCTSWASNYTELTIRKKGPQLSAYLLEPQTKITILYSDLHLRTVSKRFIWIWTGLLTKNSRSSWIDLSPSPHLQSLTSLEKSLHWWSLWRRQQTFTKNLHSNTHLLFPGSSHAKEQKWVRGRSNSSSFHSLKWAGSVGGVPVIIFFCRNSSCAWVVRAVG